MTQAVATKDTVKKQVNLKETAAQTPATSTEKTHEAELTQPEYPTVTPHHEIYSDKDASFVRIYMPGIAPDALDVELEGNRLTIHGKVTPPETHGYKLSWTEFNFKNHQISFKLPNDIDYDAIEAKMDAGLLRLKLPRKVEAKRTITIK